MQIRVIKRGGKQKGDQPQDDATDDLHDPRSIQESWIITALIIGFLGTFVWLFAAVNSFFVAGFVASATTCLVVGLLSWWWLTAWECLYRSRKA